MKEITCFLTDQSIRKTLLILNDFFSEENIEFAVTGTVALYLLGLPNHKMPHDIDLRVPRLTDKQKFALERLQSIFGDKSKYGREQTCYNFSANGIAVNVLVVDEPSVTFDCLKVLIADFVNGGSALINVQRAYNALQQKMKLKRQKDQEYMLGLISSLSNL